MPTKPFHETVHKSDILMEIPDISWVLWKNFFFLLHSGSTLTQLTTLTLLLLSLLFSLQRVTGQKMLRPIALHSTAPQIHNTPLSFKKWQYSRACRIGHFVGKQLTSSAALRMSWRAKENHPFTRLNTEIPGDLMLKTSLSARVCEEKLPQPFKVIGPAPIMYESRPHKWALRFNQTLF